MKPEHDKHVTDQNKQRGPTSADAKPRVVLRPKLPASQIARKRPIDRRMKLLNKSLNVPGRMFHLPDQEPAGQKGPSLPNQMPVAQKEPPQRQSNGNTDNNNPPPMVNQPAHDNSIPVRHFEPNPLLEVPQQDKDPQEIVSQHPIHSTGNPNVVQDPFDTEMEVPFTEDNVEFVFKRPEMADFDIPPVLEEMISDGSLIYKHLPKQADIDKILTQINRKYLRKMHLPCSLKDMQAAYMQSPHFCDIYNVIMFNRYPKHRKAIVKLQQAMLSQYLVQGGLLYIYIYVVSCGASGNQGSPRLRFCSLFRQFHVNALWTHATSKVHHLFSDITLSMVPHLHWSCDLLL